LITVDRPKHTEGIWDDFCFTDVDPASYAGEALNEFVFYTDESGRVTSVGLSAFRVKLERQERGREGLEEGRAKLKVQGL